MDNSVDSMQIFPTMYLFVPDIKEIIEPLKDLTWGSNDEPLLSLHWYYGFDLPCEDEVQMRIQDQITHQISELTSSMDESTYSDILLRVWQGSGRISTAFTPDCFSWGSSLASFLFSPQS